MAICKAQALEALDRANAVRTGRKELKQDLKAGRVCPTGMVLDPPAVIETAKVGEVLKWVPKVGAVKSKQITMKAGVSPTKRIARLTPRQRLEIAMRLP